MPPPQLRQDAVAPEERLDAATAAKQCVLPPAVNVAGKSLSPPSGFRSRTVEPLRDSALREWSERPVTGIRPRPSELAHHGNRPHSDGGDVSRRLKWRWRWLIAAGIPTVVTALHAAWYGYWIVDDAGISFAYARSLASGAGPVLQPGATPVEGYSDPAWLAVLVVGRRLGLFDHGAWFGIPDLVMFPKLVGLLCCLGTFSAMFAIARKVLQRPVLVTVVAGTVTAAIPSFVIWTTSGLENGLFGLAVMALAAVIARAAVSGGLLLTSTAVSAGALAALAALTRPDGIIYAAAFPVAATLMAHRDTAKRTMGAALTSVGVFAAPVGAYLVWRMITFGDYLPSTARAKEQALPTLSDFGRPAELIVYLGWLTAILAVAVVAVAVSKPSPTRTAVSMLLVVLGLAVVSYAILRPDWMAQHRFATPVWPLATLAVALSTGPVLRATSLRGRVVTAVVATMAGVLTLHGFLVSGKEFRVNPSFSLCECAQNTGYMFNGYADILGVRGGTLLAVDAGGTSLTTRLRYVDLQGLTDLRIARFWQHDDMAGLRNYIFDELHPSFIKVWTGWSARERLRLDSDPRLDRDYVLMWSGRPGSGEWARRDAVPNLGALARAHDWGRYVWALTDSRYRNVAQRVWWCGDVLRPTPSSPGVPAPSPLTR